MMAPVRTVAAKRRALVVFSGQTELAWLRMLRPGFRHCFVVLEFEGEGGAHNWVLYNPLSNGTQVDVWPSGYDAALHAWCAERGYEIVETRVNPLTTRLFSWRPYTCVEAVKRVLRLRKPWVFTPWQLYRTIKNTEKEKSPLQMKYDGI